MACLCVHICSPLYSIACLFVTGFVIHPDICNFEIGLTAQWPLPWVFFSEDTVLGIWPAQVLWFASGVTHWYFNVCYSVKSVVCGFWAVLSCISKISSFNSLHSDGLPEMDWLRSCPKSQQHVCAYLLWQPTHPPLFWIKGMREVMRQVVKSKNACQDSSCKFHSVCFKCGANFSRHAVPEVENSGLLSIFWPVGSLWSQAYTVCLIIMTLHTHGIPGLLCRPPSGQAKLTKQAEPDSRSTHARMPGWQKSMHER